MTEVQTRKRELLVESDLNRKVLQLELGQWQLRVSRAQMFAPRNTLGALFRVVGMFGGAASLWRFITRRR